MKRAILTAALLAAAALSFGCRHQTPRQSWERKHAREIRLWCYEEESSIPAGEGQGCR